MSFLLKPDLVVLFLNSVHWLFVICLPGDFHWIIVDYTTGYTSFRRFRTDFQFHLAQISIMLGVNLVEAYLD